MPSFNSLIKKAREKQTSRTTEENKFPALMKRADNALIDREKILLPTDKPINDKKASQIANFVMGKSNTKPKFAIKTKPKTAFTFSQLVSAPKPKKDTGHDVLFGTGITKKIATSAAKAEASQIESKEKLIIPQADKLEQPEIISMPVPSDIKWDEYQLAALKGLRQEKYSCLIGAAGTGKTTVTKQLVAELEQSVNTIDLNTAKNNPESDKPDYNVAICFCSFTGRAVQQMKKALPKEYHPLCNTVHATLGYMPVPYEIIDEESGIAKNTIRFEPTFTAMRKLPFEICIIDEGGMLGIHLWNELFAALPESCRIIIIGDINQLPPVQGRSVLGFAMIKWPTFTLEHIHRQAADNPIIANAHRILKGHLPAHDNKKFVVRTIDEGSLGTLNTAISVVKFLHKKELFNPLRDAIIVPQNKGALGQIHVNEKLIHYFNPQKKDDNGAIMNKRHIIHAGRLQHMFAVGDKVMLLQNDRERGLTNGMCGVVTDIAVNGLYKGQHTASINEESWGKSVELDMTNFKLDIEEAVDTKEEEEDENKRQASHLMTVAFQDADKGDEVVFQTAGQFKKVTIAYAFTCHKSQGGEYPTVIIVLHSANAVMLCREWLYTAVTRAQERVILICNDRGLEQSINTQRIKGKTVKEKAEQFLALQDRADTSTPTLPEPEKM